MKRMIIWMICIALLSLNGCTLLITAYIRNFSASPAMVDVYLPDKTGLKNLPNRVRVANTILKFKPGFKNYFDDYRNVNWIDLSHFTFEVPPRTTVALSDMTGIFMNMHPTGDWKVFVTTGTKTDTLLHGRDDFRRDKFGYKNAGINARLLYYDIK